MAINENKSQFDLVSFSEYNTIAATTNDITENGLPQKLFFVGTDHAGIQVNSLTTTERDALTPVNGDIIYNTTTTQFEFYENGSWRTFSAAGSGEANTASNVGTGGTGVFKQKTGVDLEFNNLIAASNRVSISLDAVDNEIDIDVNEANLSITESQISDLGSYITADSTDALTNKTIDADATGNVLTNIGSSEIKSEIITGQTTVTAVSGDFLLLSDTSDTGNLKKVDALDFLTGGGGISAVVDDTTPQLGGNLDVNGFDIVSVSDGNVDIAPDGTGQVQVIASTVYFDAEFDNGNSGAADTIDWRQGNKQLTTLTDNTTLTFTAPGGAASLILRIVQDGTGSRTITWPGNVRWPGGTAPTLSTAAGAIDIVGIYYDGTNYYGDISTNFS